MPQRLFLASPGSLLLRNMRLPLSSWQFANNILMKLYRNLCGNKVKLKDFGRALGWKEIISADH
jgi:hypothetical protein